MNSSVVLSVNALYPTHGLLADALSAEALGDTVLPVCTAIAVASHGSVTDVTDVPVDTVRAQFEHLSGATTFDGLKIGVLANHSTAEAVLSFAQSFSGSVLLDLKFSGAYGETVLTQHGIEVVRTYLGVPDLTIISRTDAELLSGGEIASLDDAQVAAQRIVRLGCRAVVIKCGPLPARFFEVEGPEDPDAEFNSDLFYNGAEFALFEAPHLFAVQTDGASNAFSLAILHELIRGTDPQEAVQFGKQFVTEALRATQALGPQAPLQYFWRTHASHP